MALPADSYLVSLVAGVLPDHDAFQSADLVAALERYGRDVDALALSPTLRLSGEVRWESGERYWGEGVALHDSGGATLTPTAENLEAGWWVLPATGPSVVYATGRVYRPWAAAAALIEQTIADLQGEAFDFSLGGDQVKLSTRFQDWRRLAERLWQRDAQSAPPQSIPLGGGEWTEW